jgi:exopolysaccharide biosynthesis polyprenyl glycosylphosphotransferase
MINQQVYQITNILMLLDGIILIFTGHAAYTISIEMASGSLVMSWLDYVISVMSLMFLNNFLMGRYGFYSGKRFLGHRLMVLTLLKTVTLDFVILATGAVLMGISPFPRLFILSYYLLAFVSLLGVRLALYYYLDHHARFNFNAWKILLVGSEPRIEMVASALEKQRSWGHQIIGCLIVDGSDGQCPGGLRNLGGIADFDRILHEYEVDEVVFALPKVYPLRLENLLHKCEVMGIAVKIVPSLFEQNDSHRLRVESLLGIPMLSHAPGNISAAGWLYKRLLDVAGGLVGCTLLLLMYPFVALMIKLDSPGPVLFRQVRIGRNGRQFYLYKFRTMVADAEERKSELLQYNEMKGPMFKVDADPRITRVGRFLRKTSLDEFPQFMNILKGEMSLVGTRPPTPGEVRQYEDWHRRRISATPGLTGLWQISGRNKISNFVEVVKLDLEYIDKWHFTRDLWILWKTVWVVLERKGAK